MGACQSCSNDNDGGVKNMNVSRKKNKNKK